MADVAGVMTDRGAVGRAGETRGACFAKASQAGGGQRQAARERWVGLLAEWRASGRSGRAFCHERGLAYAQWLYWRRRLAGATGPSAVPASGRTARLSEQALAAFVALPADGPAAAPRSAESCGLRLRLAGSWELVLERGFDAGELRRLLEVLTTPC